MAQSRTERAPGSRPNTQWAHQQVTSSLGDRQRDAAATQALRGSEPQATHRTGTSSLPSVWGKGSNWDPGRRSQLKTVFLRGFAKSPECFALLSRVGFWAWGGEVTLGHPRTPWGREAGGWA